VTPHPTNLRDLFLLDPDVHFLNHGSFGATPKPVFEEYQRWQRELERQPVEFLGRRHESLLREAREALSSYLNVDADSLVFVTNATWGVNVIARSLELEPDDEVLTTDHEYGACTMTWEHLLAKTGARLCRHTISLPVTTHEEFVESLWGAVTPRTKVIYLSHITSPTALIFPIKEVCRRARENGILTVVDGAHAPGQIPLDLQDLGVDIYTGNLHKWLCTPKGSGFLYVRPEEQDWIESLVISWGWGRGGVINPDSTFVQRNEWQGTRDIAPFLAVPAAIRFQEEHDWPAVRACCHELARQARERLAELTGLAPIQPDSTDWFAQMVAARLPTDDPETLKARLYDDYRVEVPLSRFQGASQVRVSFQAYNDQADLDALIAGLQRLL
jgi:isopenicillin-N epimerase